MIGFLYWVLIVLGAFNIIHSQIVVWNDDYSQATYRLIVGAALIFLAENNPRTIRSDRKAQS